MNGANADEVMKASDMVVEACTHKDWKDKIDPHEIVLARFARAALPRLEALDNPPVEVAEAMERIRRIRACIETSQVIYQIDDQNIHTAAVKVKRAMIDDERRLLDWALTLTAKPEPKS